MRKIVIACLAVGLSIGVVHAQSVDSVANKIGSFPSRLLARISSRTSRLNDQLTNQTEKYLQKMASREQQLSQRLAATDPAAAQRLFGGSAERYAALERQLRADTPSRTGSFSGQYMPYLDSLQGSMAYLKNNPQLLGNGSTGQLAQLQAANSQVQTYEAKLMAASQARTYIEQRKQQIGQYIAQHANLQGLLGKPYAAMNQDVYYYSQQLQGYKDMWTNPDQLTQKALGLLNRVPDFQSFMSSNSMLTGLFSSPGSNGPAKAISGLQTRSQIAKLVNAQVSAGAGAAGGEGGDPSAALQSKIQGAQSQLDEFKRKLSQQGSGSSEMDVPDFKPNDQKTKTFLKRLEYGANFQTTRNSTYFPIMTDLGLSLGYKLGHNNVIGVGASYKLGWGNGFQHVAFTNEGVGLRSFLQIAIKGSFAATGGFEYNYATPFTSYQQLKQIQYWTSSGLIGISKTIEVKSRFFKKTNVQLLWDFLSYRQTPPTQPFLFRIGYVWN